MKTKKELRHEASLDRMMVIRPTEAKIAKLEISIARNTEKLEAAKIRLERLQSGYAKKYKSIL